ncbi:MAG: helix-turn-helix domain-containing protein [Tetrasphaera sp.]
MRANGQFDPVARASELLSEKWMSLILRELMLGTTRYGELIRALPTLSQPLLSKRLRELLDAGVIERRGERMAARYHLTEAGWDLEPIITAMGAWAQRWAPCTYDRADLDPALLMWDIHRMLVPAGLAEGRTVIEFRLHGGTPANATFWLVVGEEIEMRHTDPGPWTDLAVDADMRALTEVWLGDRTMRSAMDDGLITLTGPGRLTRRFPRWFGQHPIYAKVRPAGSEDEADAADDKDGADDSTEDSTDDE